MIHFDKIIKALELCTLGADAHICYESDCPYQYIGCVGALQDDILALLKAQLPRVLTVEELEALPKSAPVCIEERVPVEKWDGGSVLKWVGSDFARETYLGENVYYNPKTYNATWRAWTNWPSVDMREEVKWE